MLALPATTTSWLAFRWPIASTRSPWSSDELAHRLRSGSVREATSLSCSWFRCPGLVDRVAGTYRPAGREGHCRAVADRGAAVAPGW